LDDMIGMEVEHFDRGQGVLWEAELSPCGSVWFDLRSLCVCVCSLHVGRNLCGLGCV